MKQRIEKYWGQLSDLLKIHRGFMSNFFDNLQACYAHAVILIWSVAKDFVFPSQRASFTIYFTLGFFVWL